MDSTGEQLHPNWRALSTLHIPLKRFIREGTELIQQGTHSASDQKKYEIDGVNGQEVKQFYEELVVSNGNKEKPSRTNESIRIKKTPKKLEKLNPFDVNKFHRYAMQNNVEELKLMSISSRDVDARDGFGWTALIMAACEGALEAVKHLIALGADCAAKDSKGMTAMDIAMKKNHRHLIDILQFGIAEQEIDDTDNNPTYEATDPFYCDICRKTFSETSRKQHQTSTVHQFNSKSDPTTNKLQKFNIPPRNRGLQLMVKQGWDKESGLGPSHSGRLYPIKTVIRKQRSGLGIDQDPARVTHFQAFDRAAVQRHKSDFYKKKPRNRNDIKREKVREWKRDRRLRNELN